MTVGDLKDRLLDLPQDLPIDLMIETDKCQYQYPLDSVAVSTRYVNGSDEGKMVKVILIYEKRTTG